MIWRAAKALLLSKAFETHFSDAATNAHTLAI